MSCKPLFFIPAIAGSYACFFINEASVSPSAPESDNFFHVSTNFPDVPPVSDGPAAFSCAAASGFVSARCLIYASIEPTLDAIWYLP